MEVKTFEELSLKAQNPIFEKRMLKYPVDFSLRVFFPVTRSSLHS